MKVNKLSIIVPALNEIGTIKNVYKRLSHLNIGVSKEVIIVDDGSKDGTTAYLKKLEKAQPKGFIFLFHKKRHGKGAAIRTALVRASGSHVAIQDADNEYDPKELGELVAKAQNGEYGAVYGSRNKNIKNNYLYPLFFWGSRVLSALINILFGQHLTDPVTCFKLIPADLLRFIQIKENGFGVEIEITCKIAGLHLPISEVSITYNPRTFAEGKKIRTKDGIYSIYLILKHRLKDLHYGFMDRVLRRLREDKVLSQLSLTKKTTVIDVGCGRQAHLGWRVRERIGRYVGVDTEVPSVNMEKISLIQMDIDRLSVARIKEKADAIVACAVIEHIKNPQRFVAVSRRLLKPGGLLCITTPHPKTHEFLKLIARLHIIDPKEIHDHKYYFSVGDLQTLLAAEGFRVVHAKRFLFGMNGIVVGKKL